MQHSCNCSHRGVRIGAARPPAASPLLPCPLVGLLQRLLGGLKYDVLEALVYMGPLTSTFLAAGSWAFEWRSGLSTHVR